MAETKTSTNSKNSFDKLSPFQADLMLYQQLFQIRSPLDAVVREIAENMTPTRTRFVLQTSNNLGPLNDNIFDSTALLSIRTAVAGLLAGVTSPASPWINMGVDDDELAKLPAVKFFTEFLTNKLLKTLDKSNFYREMALHYLDVMTLPAAVTLIEKDDTFKFRFNTLSWGTYVLGVDENGDVNTIGREEEWTVRQIVPKFCKMNDDGSYDLSNLSMQSQNAWRLGTIGQNQKGIVCQMVKPNPEYDPKKPQDKYKKWSSRYFEKINLNTMSSNYGGKFLRESGFDYFPAMVSRWSTRSQEIYSNDNPAFMALGDVKQLYKNTEDSNHQIDLTNDPPMTGPDAFNNDLIQKGPGGFTPDNSTTIGAGLRPLFEIGKNIEWIESKRKDLRDLIRKCFFVDTILAASSLRDSITTQVTATEIEALRDERLVEFGPVTQSFFRSLRHLIDVVFYILNEAGEIPQAPPELQGRDLPPDFISPFARAQKIAQLTPLEKLLTITGEVAAWYPPVVNKVNIEQVVEEIGKIINAKAGIIRTDDEANQLTRQQMQQQAQQHQAEQAQSMAKTAQVASQTPTDDPNSLLSKLGAMASAGQLTKVS